MWKSQKASDNKGRTLFAFPGTLPLLYYTTVFVLLSTAWGAGIGPVYVSCGPKQQSSLYLLWAQNQVQHDREMSETLKCKGWSDLKTT